MFIFKNENCIMVGKNLACLIERLYKNIPLAEGATVEFMEEYFADFVYHVRASFQARVLG